VGAVDIYVGELSSGKILCRTTAAFSSSSRIEWRSKAAREAEDASGGSRSMALKLEEEFVGDERERNLRRDFESQARSVLFKAVKDLSPGFEPVSTLFFR